jgi:hypothetical protein
MPITDKKPPQKRYLSDREINATYGLGEALLKKLRMRNIGPEFRRFGHRTILYDVVRLEEWIAAQPKGGGR